MGENKYIRFDWAMKRLLRQKANFGILEGLLTTLLGMKIKIKRMLESESNQDDESDKYNRVDMLAENDKGELFLIEVQNNTEYAYFQRMLFGTSKLVTEYIKKGEGYENVRKVYSVNIVYFSLGKGTDIVYHGKTEFRGIQRTPTRRPPHKSGNSRPAGCAARRGVRQWPRSPAGPPPAPASSPSTSTGSGPRSSPDPA